MLLNMKDVAAGLVFLAIGAFFIVGALLDLEIGTAYRMGPGYFPLVLGGVLAVMGGCISIQAIGSSTSALGKIPWRGILLLGSAPVLFGILVEPAGLVPAIALTTLLSSLASRKVNLLTALGLTAGLTIFCVAVFSFGLGISVPLFGR